MCQEHRPASMGACTRDTCAATLRPSWQEYQSYNFNAPGYQPGTGHFTAVRMRFWLRASVRCGAAPGAYVPMLTHAHALLARRADGVARHHARRLRVRNRLVLQGHDLRVPVRPGECNQARSAAGCALHAVAPRRACLAQWCERGVAPAVLLAHTLTLPLPPWPLQPGNVNSAQYFKDNVRCGIARTGAGCTHLTRCTQYAAGPSTLMLAAHNAGTLDAGECGLRNRAHRRLAAPAVIQCASVLKC